MTSRMFTGVLTGPEGGPYRVMHGLGSQHVTVSVRGYLGGENLAVIEIPENLYTWVAETENCVVVDTAVPPREDLPDGGRLLANGMTVVVTRSEDPAR